MCLRMKEKVVSGQSVVAAVNSLYFLEHVKTAALPTNSIIGWFLCSSAKFRIYGTGSQRYGEKLHPAVLLFIWNSLEVFWAGF